MPRTGRIVVPNTPHHIVQRGHNKQPVFFAVEDYEAYLCSLREWACVFDVKVFGYCLMTNHVHLILEPGSNPASLANLMKRVSGRFTRRINKLLDRTGTLWESRYRSSPIQTDGYLLACCRYVDLNPVSAGMVKHPADYRWSSFRQKTSNEGPAWIDLDPCYLSLGTTSKERMQRYERFVNDTPPARHEVDVIEGALTSGNLTGNDQFAEYVERLTGKRVEKRERGRPRREKK